MVIVHSRDTAVEVETSAANSEAGKTIALLDVVCGLPGVATGGGLGSMGGQSSSPVAGALREADHFQIALSPAVIVEWGTDTVVYGRLQTPLFC